MAEDKEEGRKGERRKGDSYRELSYVRRKLTRSESYRPKSYFRSEFHAARVTANTRQSPWGRAGYQWKLDTI